MKLDSQERLVWNSDFAVGVLGSGEQFVLIPLKGGDASTVDALKQDAFGKGYGYCGVLAVVDGEAQAKCEPDLSAVYTMMYAGLAFAHLVTDRIRQNRADDFVRFAAGLYRDREAD